MSQTHEILSPSARHRFALCAASPREEQKWPQSTGAAAIDGTHTHTLHDLCVQRDLMDPFNFVGETLEDHEGSFRVDELRAGRAKFSLDYIKGVVERLGGMATVISERKVNPAFLVGRNDMAGTVDVQIHGPDYIELIDYKDGMAEAAEAARYQLEQYAVGVCAEMKIPRGKPYPFKKMRLTVIQPKLAIKGMNPVISWDLDVNYVVDDLVGKLVAEGKSCDDPNAPMTPGALQCKYCRNKTCSARFNESMNAINVIPMLDISQQSANHDPATMTDTQLSQLLEAEPLIKQLMEGAKEEVIKRIKSGTAFSSHKLVKGRGSRVWSLSEDEIAERLKKMGVPKDIVYTSKLVSPAQAEKLTWEKKNGEKVQLSARQIKTLNSEYVTSMEGVPTLVPVSDDRPAIMYSAENLFSSIVQESQETALPSWMM